MFSYKNELLSYIDTVEKEHPYSNDTFYSEYNEAWCDALDRIRSYIDGIPVEVDNEYKD